ncbi:MAG: amino acid ABC transporter permease [Eubacteriales bacterium]|jgi:His/Glu/Gln/Arg/opine family amino acid ABC transporter permease subunit
MSFWESVQQQFIASFITDNRWQVYLKGLLSSLELTIVALILGIVIGILVAIVRTDYDQKKGKVNRGGKILNGICVVYTTVIRGTPTMVQLLIMNFVIFANSRNLYLIAVLTLGINSGAYVSEIFRSGIESIDPGQMEAGRSLGMNYATVMKDIIIPQAVKNVLPALGNELITLFKDTSLVSVIGMSELTKAARDIQAITYLPIFPFLGIAAIYLVVVMILTWLQGKLERRLKKSDR